MKYLEWNNIVGAYLFNERMAGKEVHLFLSRQDIVQAGRAGGCFIGQSDNDVWNNFIHAIEIGFSTTLKKPNYLEKLEHAFERRNYINVDSVKILYPPYVGYMVLTIIPILETANSQSGDTLRANNYYARVRDFLKANNLPDLPNMSQSQNWNHIWQHLSDWSIKTKKTDFGIFQVRNFSTGWKYAGIPLSQCLINPKALKRLPEVFLKEGLLPNSFINDKEWRDLLKRVWVKDLGQRTEILEHISKDDDEMGRVVLDIVKQVYGHWQGETELEEAEAKDASIRRIRKAGIRARLFLSFKIDKSTFDLKWGCRMYSKNDYPEDLVFIETDCYEVRENWSNQLRLGFLEKANLKDIVNKWEAVLPEKDLRFFIGGATLNLDSDFWVETDQMNRISPMCLLCKNNRREEIENWGRHFQPPGSFKELTSNDLGDIPEGWSLFKFQYPKESIEGEPSTYLNNHKKILLIGGVKTGNRIYQKGCLPEVYIENGDGSEKVLIEIGSGRSNIQLNRRTAGDTRWLLPDTLQPGDEFWISIGEEKTFPIRIAAETLNALKLDNFLCPKRNRYGKVVETQNGSFVQGSLVQGFDFTRQYIYKHHFQPGQRPLTAFSPLQGQFIPENDFLLEFITRKKSLRSEDFFEAFENILSIKISGELDEAGVNLTSLKRQVLNWYDFLGYIDFDYQSKGKQIVVNPPQLFLIPTNCGRRAFLTGARTPDFVEKVFERVRKWGLQIEIIPQASLNKPWILMPDTIIIETQNMPGYGMSELKSFAKDLDIYFDPEHIAQWGLLNFSADIDDYEKSLTPDERFEDYDCPRKIFNPNAFRFDRVTDENFDKTFSLIEYQHTAYTYYHILWKNGIANLVDKSWGRWLVLKHFKKQAVFLDKKGMTAIPAGMPLPRLISEALLLCSGSIPEQKFLEVNGIRTIFSLYGNVVKIMLDNEFSRIGQTPILANQIF